MVVPLGNWTQGGMITVAAVLKEVKAFDGVVLMGPLIHIDPAMATPIKIWTARMLSRIAPNLTVRPTRYRV